MYNQRSSSKGYRKVILTKLRLRFLLKSYLFALFALTEATVSKSMTKLPEQFIQTVHSTQLT